MTKTLKELSCKGRKGYSLPKSDVPVKEIKSLIPEKFLRKNHPSLPEVSEYEIYRHFTQLSHKNYSLSTNFYPLGSCTMKYNPPINEKISALPGFLNTHPYQNEETIQGSLELMYNLEKSLCEISGMDAFTLQPAAGAHGEFTGLLIIRAYFEAIGEKRNKIIVPDSAHGTNPASAALAGFETIPLKSDSDGCLSVSKLQEILTSDVAAIMLTVPNTLGIFEKDILKISEIVHKNGSLLYYDGANLNAILGVARPGDLGFDVMHINLHKTFATPHGGGGPGSGPVGVKKFLNKFLPIPYINKNENNFYLDYNRPDTIGKIRSFYGNFPVLVKAYAYVTALGAEGLKKVGENAVLNANYMLCSLKDKVDIPAGLKCMHEFVISAKQFNQKGVKALDIAKRLLDYNYYAPTIYFPLIVEEAMMIEPTETETKDTMDNFVNILNKIFKEAQEDPDVLKQAPHNTSVSRLNEVEAARKQVLHWE